MGAWIETALRLRWSVRGASLPTWGRGLKQHRTSLLPAAEVVASHVGAWIETMLALDISGVVFVAPHVGAWIETLLYFLSTFSRRSLSAWERGLKLCCLYRDKINLWSLSAWERGLKYPSSEVCRGDNSSLPTWERGLKLNLNRRTNQCYRSLLMWERGLKLGDVGLG